MKKISKLIMVVLVLCMAFSTVAFAADSEMSTKKVNNAQEYFSEQIGEQGMIGLRAPAPPITDATITDILLDDTTGRVYAIVQVTGYGSTFGYIDGSRVDMIDSATIGSPVVTGFLYLFDCGVLSSGSHTFKYSGTSYNSPWNTVTRQVSFIVP